MQRWGWSSVSSLLGFCSQPQGKATSSELSFGGKTLLCVPRGHVGWSRKHTHTPPHTPLGESQGWCLFWIRAIGEGGLWASRLCL